MRKKGEPTRASPPSMAYPRPASPMWWTSLRGGGEFSKECQTNPQAKEDYDSMKENLRWKRENEELRKEIAFKKSGGILCEGNRLEAYRFIDQHQEELSEMVYGFHIPVPEERGCPVQLRHHRPPWPGRGRQHNGPAHHQWAGGPHTAKSIGITVTGRRRAYAAQWPGEPVYIESFHGVLRIRPCVPEHEQGRIPIRQCPDGEIFQHIEERMHKPVWIQGRNSPVSDSGRIRLCHI